MRNERNQKRGVRKILTLFLSMILMVGTLCVSDVFAASSSVSISDGSPDVGDTFTVTVYYSGDSFGSVDGALTYDPSVLSFEDCTAQHGGGNGEISFSNYQTTGDNSMAVTFYFSVIGTGSSSVTAYSNDIYNYDGVSLGGDTSSASFSVSGSSNQTSTTENNENGDNDNDNDNDGDNQNDNKPQSSNANLRSLSIACGEIKPAFSPDVTSYSVTASPNETDADITAIPEDDDATVEFGGSPILTQDEVTRTVTVVATDGTRKSYSIKITREMPEGAITVNGTTYKASENQNLSEVPAGFIASKMTYAGREFGVLKSRTGNIHLIKLIPEGGSEEDAGWFSYDPNTQAFTPSEIIESNGNKYAVIKRDLDLVYGGSEASPGYMIYNPETGELQSAEIDGVDNSETPIDAETDDITPDEQSETSPTQPKKKSSGLLWLIIGLIILLAIILTLLQLRGVFGKNKAGDPQFDDEDDENGIGSKILMGLAGVKENITSRFSKNNDDIFADEKSEKNEMSERRIERRRRIAEAEAKAAQEAVVAAGGATVSTDNSNDNLYNLSYDDTPISEGSVVTKAELEAAKIAAANRAQEEAARAADELKAAQEAKAAAIAARDAARAAKAKIASSQLNSSMDDFMESAEELSEALNKKED